MKIRDFVNEYTSESDEKKQAQIILNHVTRKYATYLNKVTLCRSIVKAACYKDGLFKIDTPMLMFLFISKVIEVYTDLEFDPDDAMHDFDLIEERGLGVLITQAIGNDYSTFESVLTMTIDDARQNETNIPSFIQKLNDNMTDILTSKEFTERLANLEHALYGDDKKDE